MIELEIVGLRFEMSSDNPVLLLKEVGGHRHLAMWIGPVEAMAIGTALAGENPARPMTHDLLVTILAELGVGDIEARIVGVDEGVFFAELEIEGRIISARPSDVVALAVRRSFPISCAEAVMDQVGVELSSDDRDEVEEFRDFLANVEPDDFRD